MKVRRPSAFIWMLPAILCACSGAEPPLPAAQVPPPTIRDTAQVLADSSPSDWRTLDPENTLYMELPTGRVVIDLAPSFAPRHVANIKALAREGYFDGLAILRAQDNYVVQWGDPEGTRQIKAAARTLPGEFTVPLAGLPFTKLETPDSYAAEVGFSNGLPAARDAGAGLAWLAHCYGMVGVGRDTAPDSGGGTELYAVIGHAPRHLDRNVTVVGRIVRGMEFLSTLPRGTGAIGFYETPAERTPIKAIKVAADVPEAQRTKLEVIRTDTSTFAALVDSRRHRQDEWFQYPVDGIELCNAPLTVREQK